MQFDAGFAADAGGRLGVAGFTSDMLTEGTRTRDALEIEAEAERLGASIGSGASLDTTAVTLSALSDNLEPSIRLWADVILNASFPDEAIERLRNLQLAAIEQEASNPSAIASRILPPLLYGEGHAYGVPFTGTGTEASTRAITRADLVTFRGAWLRPDNATIFVAGDTSMNEIRPMLERAFRNWRAPSAPLPAKNIGEAPTRTGPRVIIVDRAGSPQSLILAGRVGPRGGADNDVALSAMNDVFGGDFTARLNMNLREDKHWAYGAYASLQGARGPRPFFVRAPVQTDRTGDSMREILREIADINGARPITAGEMAPVILNNVRQWPGAVNSQGAVLRSMSSAALYGRSFDYVASLPERYEALTLDDLQNAAREVVRADDLIWVIIGDRAHIEPQVAALNIAPIEIFNADGAPQTPP